MARKFAELRAEMKPERRARNKAASDRMKKKPTAKSAAPLKRKSTTHEHREALTTLGELAVELAGRFRVKDDGGLYEIGLRLDQAMKAGIKAMLPGKQKDRHVEDQRLAVRRAVTRQLRRTIDRLPVQVGGDTLDLGGGKLQEALDALNPTAADAEQPGPMQH